MKTMKWLLKREMWEHKGMLLWTPVAIAGAIAALVFCSLFLGKMNQMMVDGAPVTSITIEGSARLRIAQVLSEAYVGAGMPVLMVLGLLVFFYCLGALNDERRDRSLLFWKSLPVSDLTTVLSKVLMALVVAPLITLGIALVLGVVTLLTSCLMLLSHGTNLFGELLVLPSLYLTPLRLLGLLPVYILWALPTVGWLLMVSSMARSKVFLWAVGTPVITSLLLMWAQKILHLGIDAGWFASNIINRILLGVMPGAWFPMTGDRVQLEIAARNGDVSEAIFNGSWATLGGVGVWVGAVAGVGMIAIAVWMRRRREEA
ncbi:hypothetical protein GJ699_00580 [Duganella sp. FT80W]|uniref:Uncharacterized protein n=1 Tax=Duganella guangzhouensis TaxID=2666084 RepID=A0A6I2KS00_9BURK|nr:hypothetical protein [Duganella guangzhouensis]MRW88475.1 hypothetical protein [Duganella guangzhouensis]